MGICNGALSHPRQKDGIYSEFRLVIIRGVRHLVIVMRCRFFYLGLASVLALSCSRGLGGDLTADQIIHKAVERAETKQSNDARRGYLYNKFTVTETLDSRGRVQDRKEKVFLVQSGKAYLQGMKLNGQVSSAGEVSKEEATVGKARQEVTESKSSQRDENWERFLSKDLIGKYTFMLDGTETVNGRDAYVLRFRPAAGDLPVRAMADRVLNLLMGKVWIDAAEFEIAKANISLQSQASFGGLLKIVGAINRMDYSVERVRVGENAWFNRATQGIFETRKFWDCSRVRVKSESQGFQKNHSAQNLTR